jgi:hypothetical protein
MIRDLLRIRYVQLGVVLFILLVANIAYYICSNWGLITVKVSDKPLGLIIKSIERQGWVTIYSNIDPNLKVSMDVDHVPLAEAMETLAVNITIPPPDEQGASPGGPPTAGGQTTGGGSPPGAQPSGGFGGGNRGRRGGPREGGAQWHLAFFVAPTSAEVKQEIRLFQEDNRDENTKIYNYPTPLQMLDSDMPAAEPWRQVWPGKEVTDATAQGYLKALAQSADIWIMAPSAWNPPVKSGPAANVLISRAVKNVVGYARGSVTQALVLQARGRGFGGGGGRGGGGAFGSDDMEDRMRNAINGLPPDQRADALEELNNQIKVMQNIRAAPPEQQRNLMTQYMGQRMADNANNRRMTPQKRAQRYERAVSNRMAAQGNK